MKKIDLHLHTVPTFSDAHFEFSLDKLNEYVTVTELDAIAITNHDVFDLAQFQEIQKALDCIVFPGIEIYVDNGHILLISENENLEDFQFKANKVSEKIKKAGDNINVEELIQIFGNLNDYLIIPHYQKKPSISKDTFEQLRAFIDAGEVDSPKKFVRMAKDENEITPVLFSDVRIKDSLRKFPPRQTYIDCGELTISAIKHSLSDRSKVALSKSDGNKLFQIFDDGQQLSTGLNIVLGARSSGKTVTLNRINEECNNVKYIPQFSLVQRDDSNYEKEFNEGVARKKSNFVDKHLAPFKAVLDDVSTVDLVTNHRKVDEYLETLMKQAEEVSKRDAFSKVTLFNESQFEIREEKGLTDLIISVRLLIENIEYRDVIDKHVNVEDLKALACELIESLWEKILSTKKKNAVNEAVRDVKSKLKLRSSSTQVKDVDLYKVMIEHKKVLKFKLIAKQLQTEKIIHEENIQGFKVVCKQRAFNGAGEVRNVSGKRVAFTSAYKEYSSPYKYLLELKNNEALTPSEFYKYFACIEYEILNKDGFKVSGGERSEFRLLQEIKDAQNYDYLLIDEPESSFDNIFLKGEVNQILKELSQTMPIVVVTHNSTVGASIKADYVVYTSKEIENGEIVYRRYSGHPSVKELSTVDGIKMDNFKVTIDSLEAGEIAYTERKSGYESIKN
ncbi:histidinol phosphatase [Shewanella sp. 1_MG-2023]|uniref:histidinol phosphatase n=1 Tax=unclassified Shewanella TaxID=196818 RepID=UPI0026E26A0D|nr:MULTISPECIES: histidinol phosphatase [unclassified Shewanella]MDO6613386.1 histidinol phosphatase [Shewanella sp. 7_MG-2023]MDO6773194.1 histidinol phosphatase [Shewanella sp. 2_MG-2023]MDO6795396.1 histidinol phosphatase [Shewanella sp. 1_MG-2023]